MVQIHPARAHAIAWLVLAYATCATSLAQSAATGERKPASLEYRAECSEVKPRESVLRLRWAAARGRKARIEVSPYKDGFRTGRFFSTAAGDPRGLAESGMTLLGPQDRKAAASMLPLPSIRLQSLREVAGGAQIEAFLVGLVPGLNYYVRVRGVTDEVLRVQASTCPVTFTDSPREAHK